MTADQCAQVRSIAAALRIPVISNGGSLDIKQHADIGVFRTATGASSVMVARAAQWNMSVFRSEGLVAPRDVVRDYLQLALRYDNSFTNSKFCVLQTLTSMNNQAVFEAAARCKTMRELCDMFDLQEAYAAAEHYLSATGMHGEDEGMAAFDASRVRAQGQQQLESVFEADVMCPRKLLGNPGNPKSYLLEYCHLHGVLKEVEYETRQRPDRKFEATARWLGKSFISHAASPNKKAAEQSAALIALQVFGFIDKDMKFIDLKSAPAPKDLSPKIDAVVLAESLKDGVGVMRAAKRSHSPEQESEENEG